MRWVSPLLALIVGLTAILGTNVFVFANPLVDYKYFLAITLSFALVAVITMRRVLHGISVPGLFFGSRL